MEKFRQLSASSERMLVDNFRHLQPLNNRRVFVRLVSGNSERIQRINDIHYAKWDWLKPEKYDFNNEISTEAE